MKEKIIKELEFKGVQLRIKELSLRRESDYSLIFSYILEILVHGERTKGHLWWKKKIPYSEWRCITWQYSDFPKLFDNLDEVETYLKNYINSLNEETPSN